MTAQDVAVVIAELRDLRGETPVLTIIDRCIRAIETIESLALDAERYRFLRSRDLDTIHEGGVFAGLTPDNIVLNEDDLDREVDAARDFLNAAKARANQEKTDAR